MSVFAQSLRLPTGRTLLLLECDGCQLRTGFGRVFTNHSGLRGYARLRGWLREPKRRGAEGRDLCPQCAAAAAKAAAEATEQYGKVVIFDAIELRLATTDEARAEALACLGEAVDRYLEATGGGGAVA